MKTSFSAILLLTLCCNLACAAEAQADRARDSAGQPAASEDPTAAMSAEKASASGSAQPGAINPATGQYLPPTGTGDVINPMTGERYLGIPGGYVNPNTGEVMPKIR